MAGFDSTHRRSLAIMIRCLLLLILPVLGSTGLFADTSRPNVVIVLTDDQGYGDLGVHGHPFVKTPHLDRLHAESVRLTDFHVMPLCAPTRAMLMTGRNPLRVGVWATVLGRSILPADVPTMPQLFSANGYATGMFGKWHLGDNAPARPQDKGFQTAFYHGGGGVGQTPDFWGNDYIDDTYFRNGVPEKSNGYCTDVWFDAAKKFMSQQKQADRPFFTYIATNAPHSPYIPPPDLTQAYRDVPGIDTPTAAFYAMIENIDTNLGKLRQFLVDQKLDDNTILIYLTDNGTAQGLKAPGSFNSGMRASKGSLYEGGHRVPLFLRWPGGGLPGPAGRDVKSLTSGVDLLPTLATLCGLNWGNFAKEAIDGVDLSKALIGESVPQLASRSLYVQFSQADNAPQKTQAAVLRNHWRLVNDKELYDIDSDPGQKINLYDRHPEVVASLRAEHSHWYESIAPSFQKFHGIFVGSDQENPVQLNAMDWHTGGTPAGLAWNQSMIKNGLRGNGFWAINVQKPGTYEIQLLRWPFESGLNLNDAPKGGKALPIASAQIRIADHAYEKSADGRNKSVVFDVQLESGEQRLQTEFRDAQGNSLGGAYYVRIKPK